MDTPAETSVETCPRCKQPSFPTGRFIVLRNVKLTIPVSILFIKTTLNVTFTLRYCPGCGFSAAQDIALQKAMKGARS